MAKILVVDDEAEVRKALKKILEEEGHSIIEAEKGTEAINLFHASKFDLVLLDLNLPGITGEQVAEILKHNENSRHIPIIILTGESSTKTYIRLLEIGVEEFLIKPFSKPHILARVRSLLKNKYLNDQLLAAFSAIESLEELHTLLIKRLSENPISPTNFLEIALNHCLTDKPELGSPSSLFIALDQDNYITGQALHIDRTGKSTSIYTVVDKPKMVSALKPYEQVSSIYYGDKVDEQILRIFFKDTISGSHPLVAVKEAGYWVVATGYQRSVGFNDSRWLSSIARQYSLYISHLNQVMETEKAFHFAITSLARAAEAFDENIGEHIERVSLFSRILAENLNLSQLFVKDLTTSAVLHDVGKIQIPKEILNKPSSLTQEEMKIVMKHPEYGAKILGDNPRFQLAREIALCHHEHFDGSGYPNGLKGENIPLSARIVIIADVYDALRSSRAYKRAVSHAEALYILKNGDEKTKPSFFDPELLNAFIKLESAPDEIYNSIKKTKYVLS
ncbi:MAG: response regulator [Thermoanaerobaculaceae bacterium]|nr:response regulator [Thermoanaerobaculaceae bacterium]